MNVWSTQGNLFINVDLYVIFFCYYQRESLGSLIKVTQLVGEEADWDPGFSLMGDRPSPDPAVPTSHIPLRSPLVHLKRFALQLSVVQRKKA